VADDKLRGKPEKFADHYTQATLFWNSQTPTEQAHIVDAFRFELGKVQTPGIRTRMVAGLMNVDADLASRVAAGLGIELPDPLPRVLTDPPEPEVTHSPALSLTSRGGDGSIRTRRVALLVTDGVDAALLQDIHDALVERGAAPIYVAPCLGPVATTDGKSLQADVTLATHPPVLFDALVLPSGDAAIPELLADDRAVDFVKEQYRHCKPILVLDGASVLLEAARIPPLLPDGTGDPGLLVVSGQDQATIVDAFVRAVSRHRHYERQAGLNGADERAGAAAVQWCPARGQPACTAAAGLDQYLRP
jgi:catalase